MTVVPLVDVDTDLKAQQGSVWGGIWLFHLPAWQATVTCEHSHGDTRCESWREGGRGWEQRRAENTHHWMRLEWDNIQPGKSAQLLCAWIFAWECCGALQRVASNHRDLSSNPCSNTCQRSNLTSLIPLWIHLKWVLSVEWANKFCCVLKLFWFISIPCKQKKTCWSLLLQK